MKEQPEYDTIIIGSGFGGSMIAHTLVNAGKKVLMLERGDWVPRGQHNWAPQGSVELTPYYCKETPYRVLAGTESNIKTGYRISSLLSYIFSKRRRDEFIGGYHCVGGPSVFYGGVSMRLRERDFEPDAEIVQDSRAEWPYRYEDLEPYYERAELILNVAGETGIDPTEPLRVNGYPQSLNGLAHPSQLIKNAAERLNLRPFRLPLAINYSSNNGQATCLSCTTCDSFACSISAKNDLATRVLPGLMRKGMDLKPNTMVTRLRVKNNRISEVEGFDKKAKQRVRYRAKQVVLSAGALASPHLLLSSGLEQFNPAGHTVGRFMTRHCNAIAYAIFRDKTDPYREFHKQIAVHDFYFGHPSVSAPQGKLGGIQQLQSPPIGLVKAFMPTPMNHIVANLIVPRLIGLLIIAEDQPQFQNHLAIDRRKTDAYGLPQPLITHRYTKRDYAARNALLAKATEILKEAGGLMSYVFYIKTFSHAVGTVRMGVDPKTSPLDAYCQFRGIDNLFVVDGSFMPRSSGLNPSLTISANALRVGDYLVNA